MIFNSKRLYLLAVLYIFIEKQYFISYNESRRLLPTSQNIDFLAKILSDALLLLGEKHINENVLVNMCLPHEEDRDAMFELLEKTNLQLNSFCSLVIRLCNESKSHHNHDFHSSQGLPIYPDIYIIPLQEPNEFYVFKAHVEMLNEFEYFNPRALIVLLKLTSECELHNEDAKVVNYFSTMWKLNCLRVIVVVLSKCDSQLIVLTAEPFSLENPCRTAYLTSINRHNFTMETKELNIFYKQPHGFNGCSFTVATVPNPPYVVAKEVKSSTKKLLYEYVGGVEIEMLRLLSTKLQFAYKFDSSHGYELDAFARISENGSEFGIGYDSRHHKIDFFFGGTMPFYKKMFYFDSLPVYLQSELSCFVPNANIEPQWHTIFKVFSPVLFTSLVLVYWVFCMVYNILEGLDLKVKTILRIKNFIELFRACLNMTSALKPRSLRLKILYTVWSIYGLYWTIVYSTLLFFLLLNPPTEKEISTIEDLLNSGLKVAAPNVRLMMLSDLDASTASFFENEVKCVNFDNCIQEFLKYKNFSILDSYEHIRYLVNIKRHKVHKIQQNFLAYGVTIYLNRGNPLAVGMNITVRRMIEAGLIDYWLKEVIWKFRNKTETEDSLQEKPSPLTVEILQSVFFLLFLGYTVSALAFIVEIKMCISFFQLTGTQFIC